MKLSTRNIILAGAISVMFAMPAMADGVIKIGLAAPLSGGVAANGEQLLNGAQSAVDIINAKGGIDGKKIQLVIGDDACDPKQAVSVANRLVDQEKVVAVVNGYCTSSVMPSSEIYDQANILNITPGATNPQVTDRELPTLLRTCGRDDQQAAIDADFIAHHLKSKTAAIINDKDAYGLGLANATAAALKKMGVKVVFEDSLTRGEKDYNALVTSIKAANPDVVYFGGLYAEGGLLVKQMRQQGMKTPFVSDDGLNDPAFITAAGGKQYANGVYFSFLKDPRHNVEAQEVLKSLKAKGKFDGGFTLYSTAAVQAIVAALQANPGVTDGEKLADWLKSHKLKTVLGEVAWDKKGDVTHNNYGMFQFTADGSTKEVQ